ncbi:MAG: 4-hydroxy-tetrahydrodipicolinate synthase [Bacteroidota bacterium]
MKTNLEGTGLALVTPFNAQGKIDFTALGHIVENVIGNGIEYLVVLGTTGESVTLSKEEKAEVLQFVIEANGSQAGIVLGVGGNNTTEVISSLHQYDLKGVDAILSVSPYYNKPTQEGIFQHFLSIIEASPLPLILYNVPGRTVVGMTAETTLRIARASDKVIATKEASGNFGEITKILRDKPKAFSVISGDDSLLLPMMAIGGAGVISVAANAVPGAIASLTHLALNGEFKQAAELHLRLQTMFDALFIDGNPAGVKAALHSTGTIDNILRLPLIPVNESTYKILVREMAFLSAQH